ncbi:MAG: hypothetical protein LBV41_08545 [Cytophagaceae bacterium]|jgi:hypothetical protein|nr:hypothetical protein [Cytophagaceae bacterium]
MAKKVENSKGFLVLEVSAIEVNECFGGYGICDYCNSDDRSGYYIAVLNSWYCPKCYKEWIQRAKRYAGDIHIEERNYNCACESLGL